MPVGVGCLPKLMEKNPFSIYDFMGYLFPGLTVLYILYYLYSCHWDLFQAVDIDVLCNTINKIGNKFNFEKSVLIIIVAYIIGHLVSYISSLTVEILSNRFFGYPSKYLLQKERPEYGKLWSNYFKIKADSSSWLMKIIKNIFVWVLYLFIFLMLLPVSFMITTFGYLFNFNQFIIRPLDDYLINGIKTRQQELAKRIGLKLPGVNQECDYHRVIMHYVYLNIPACQHKVDNYIALYGFLRCMSLIFCMLFDTFFFFGVYTIYKYSHHGIAWDLIGTLFLLFVLSYVSFLAFVKFYRRQTLENLMSMLTGMPHDINEGGNTDVKKK